MLTTRKLILVFALFLYTWPSHIYTSSIPQSKNNPVENLHKEEPLSDKQEFLVSRINKASLSGDSNLMLDYYKSLIALLTGKDQQQSIIKQSFSILPKTLVYQNYTFTTNLIEHLQSRVDYYVSTSTEIKNQWKNTLSWYTVVTQLLQKENPAEYMIPATLLITIPEEKDHPDTIDTVLQQLSLGLIENINIETKLNHLYTALNAANNIHSTEFYYLISTLLVKLYIERTNYDSAIQRLSLLYSLFTTIIPSDYYRIKILIYFAQTFLAQGSMDKAFQSYLRAKDMVMFNTTISTQEADRLNKLIKMMDSQFINYAEINPTNNFLTDFLEPIH